MKLEIELQVELLEVAALKTLEDHLVPAKLDKGRGGSFGSWAGSFGFAHLPRAGRRPPPLTVVEGYVVEHVKLFVDPALGRIVPPGFLVHQNNAHPPVQCLLDAPVALAALQPAQERDQLIAREVNAWVREIAPSLGELDQSHQNLVVEGGWQTVFVRPHDRQPADDRLAVAPLQPILKHQGRLAVRNTIAQRGNRKLGKVQLILPAGVSQRGVFVSWLPAFTDFFDGHVPLIHSVPPGAQNFESCWRSLPSAVCPE